MGQPITLGGTDGATLNLSGITMVTILEATGVVLDSLVEQF